MENYKKLFANIDYINPPERLSKAIFERIIAEKKHLARKRLWYTSSAGVFSLVAIFPAIQYLIGQFIQSGFYQYLSLIFSDGGAVIKYWKEISISLAESLPILGSAIVLTLVLIILGSFKYIIQDSKTLFNKVQLA